MQDLKVYVINQSAYSNDSHYANFLTNYTLVNNAEEADIIIFTGGEDVDPSLYPIKVKRSPTTWSNLSRDMHEKSVFDSYKESGKLLVGICRGSQFLTVMNGGVLFQDVQSHAMGGLHPIETADGEKLFITSTHHQMMNPYILQDNEYEVIAWASPKRSNSYYVMDGYVTFFESFKEPEIVYYPKTNSLCIQGHPEYMNPKGELESKTLNYINKLISKIIKK